MNSEHEYSIFLQWTGNLGEGTANYNAYERTHIISTYGKPLLELSSDPVFKGDVKKYNPEELLVISISSCHMLWYLHLCSDNGVIVTEYEDSPAGIMTENSDGSGQFREVTLKPRVRVKGQNMIGKAMELHKKAHEMCFIARSCNFPVRHEPRCYI